LKPLVVPFWSVAEKFTSPKPDLERWIVSLHLVNGSLRFLRFMLVAGAGERAPRGLGFSTAGAGAVAAVSTETRQPVAASPTPKRAFQLLNALEQYPDLLR